MNFKEYLTLIAEKIDEAGEKGDKEEAIRLFSVLRNECEDQIAKLREGTPL